MPPGPRRNMPPLCIMKKNSFDAYVSNLFWLTYHNYDVYV